MTTAITGFPESHFTPNTITTTSVPQLSTLVEFVLPLLKVKDILALSSACREWRSIPEDGHQRLWSSLFHRDFQLSIMLPCTFGTYKRYATHGYDEVDNFELEKSCSGMKMIFIDKDWLVLTNNKRVIRIYDLETKECLKEFQCFDGEIKACFVNSECVVIGFSNGYIQGWNFETGQPISFERKHASQVIAFGEDSKSFISISCKGEIILWDRSQFTYEDRTREWRELDLFGKSVDFIKSCLICNGLIAVISNDNRAFVLSGLDQKKLKILCQKKLGAGGTTFKVNENSISFFPGGKIISCNAKKESISFIPTKNCVISSNLPLKGRFALVSKEAEGIGILSFKGLPNSIF